MSNLTVTYDLKNEQVNSGLIALEDEVTTDRLDEVSSVVENVPMNSESVSITSDGVIRRKWCNVAYAFLVGLIMGAFLVFVIVYGNMSSSSSNVPGKPEGGLASSQTGNIQITSDGIDFRIPQDNPCVGTSCSRCKTQVLAYFYKGQESDVDIDPRVKNSTCFECGGRCYGPTVEDLLNNERIPCENERPVEITCGIIALMGNHGQICGVGGSYNCYLSNVNGPYLVPKCQCPYGRSGDRCQDIYKKTLTCNCFHSTRPFCGQENMTDCTVPNWDREMSRCRMEAVRSGESHNCICSKLSDEADVDDLLECTVPHTESQKNGARHLLIDILPLLILICFAIFVTNNT